MTGPSGVHLLPEAPPEITIPSTLSRHALLGHALRMAHFHHEWAIRVPPAGPIAREAWAGLPRFALALSWAFDLDLVDHTVRALCAAAWPRCWQYHASPKDVIGADVPRYDAGEPPVMDRSCYGRGPRGGRCRTGDNQPARHVLDEATGTWRWVWACADHAALLRPAANRAPRPAPNRGGVLAETFPDLDLDPVYSWACSRYEPGTGAPELAPDRPVQLRVIRGGAS